MKLIRLILLWLFAFAAQPASAESASDLLGLQQQLHSLLQSKSSDVGIAALDLSSGTGISVRGSNYFPMASTVKIAVAATYLREIEAGHRSFDSVVSGGQTAAQLMRRMIIHSDNHATDLLLADLGGPRTVQTWLDQNSVKGLRIDRTISQLLNDKRDLYDHRDSATPMAMVDFLRRIDNGELLQPQSKRYLLNLMAQCMTGRNRMKWLLPEGTPVEHKTGTLNGLSDDVGFITLPNGHRIAIAVFARGGSDRPRTIAEAARTVYDGFLSMVTYPFSAAVTGR
jgi:beta-lactamase class A